jgi:DNA adenine methylase|tara:strand:- start:137 stop:928 length:792 start_codon:yes stop_codon:yes gene_type:complete
MTRIKTCLRTPGGKFYGFKHFEEYFKFNYDEYREPFIGGGSVFLSLNPAKKINWINDLDKELVNFYKVIANNQKRKKLYNLLNGEIASRERHAEVLKFKAKTDIQRAFKYFYINRTSFSGIMKSPRWGYRVGSSVIPEHWSKRIEPVGKKFSTAKITNLDFRKVILSKSSNKVLIYCDPPYYKASRGIYKKEFNNQDHLDLMKLLKKTKHRFILSYNYHEDLFKLYHWAIIKEKTWKYFMSEERRQVGKELIISNYELNPTLL